MNHDGLRNRRLYILLALLGLLAPGLMGAPVRVISWDLQPAVSNLPNPVSGSLPDNVTAEATRIIKQLNPDVIVLEDVPDSASCDKLIQALQPADYQVAVFSSFHDGATGAASRQQAAILTRVAASKTHWDGWTGLGTAAPGGYASAVVRLRNRDVAIFAVQMNNAANGNDGWETPDQQSAREEGARQLVEQIDALGDVGSGQAIVVAGDFNTTPENPKLSRELTLARLERAGLSSAFDGLPAERRVTLPGHGERSDLTVDYLFTREAGKVSNVQVIPVASTLHAPVAADLDLDSQSVSPAAVAATTAIETTLDDGSFGQRLLNEVGPVNLLYLATLLAGGIACVIVGMILLLRRSQSGPGTGMRSPRGNPPGGGLTLLSPPNAGEILVMARATQTGSAIAGGPVAEGAPVVHVQGTGWQGTETEAAEWRRRAEAAEKRADRAAGALRAGILPQLSQWLKGGFARQLMSDREQLLDAQRTAAAKMQRVDERLTRVEVQIQQRMREYEGRITDLEKELTAAREENRELIRAKIAQVRAEMERERARLLQHAHGA